MTIASQTSRISYTGDGSTTAFAVPFYFAANVDIVVYLQDTLGNQTIQVLGTNYSLTGATVSSGGTCTFTTAPATGYLISIYRDPPATQTTSYNNNDPFPAKSHELALDKLTTLAQRTKDIALRSVHQTEGEAAMTTTLAPIATRKNKLFGFGTNGEMIYAAGPTFVSGTATGVAVIDSRATAQVTTFGASTNVIRTGGFASPGDGGGAEYVRGLVGDPGAFQDAGGVYWRLNLTASIVNPRWFGAKGDGVTNDTLAIQAALNALDNSTLAAVYFPAGSYVVTGLTITNRRVQICGAGVGKSILLNTSGAASVLSISNTDFTQSVTVEDISIQTTQIEQCAGLSIQFAAADAQNNRVEGRCSISRVEVRGQNPALHGFSTGVSLINVHNGSLIDVFTSGRQSGNGPINCAHMTYGFYVQGISPGIPSDIFFYNCHAYMANYGFYVTGEVEGTSFVNCISVAVNNGFYSTHTAVSGAHPWFAAVGCHAAAFVNGIYCFQCPQSLISNCLIYKREDSTANTTAITLDTCDDSVISANTLVNANYAADPAIVGFFYGTNIFNSNGVRVLDNSVVGYNIAYTIGGTSDLCEHRNNTVRITAGGSPTFYNNTASGANNKRSNSPAFEAKAVTVASGTLNATAANLIAVSVDAAHVNDLYLVSATLRADKDGTNGTVEALIVKAGTAAVTYNGAAALRSSSFVGASNECWINVHGHVRVTAAGSLQLTLQGYCAAGAAATLAGDAALSIIRL